MCPQPFGENQIKMYGGAVSVPKMNEDCLYLNVWTPNTSPDAKLPVMVWIYGGGFVFGLYKVSPAIVQCHLDCCLKVRYKMSLSYKILIVLL